MLSFHDAFGKPKTTVLRYRYTEKPEDEGLPSSPIIKLKKQGCNYEPEKDFFLYLGTLNWKLTAKIEFKSYSEKITLQIPHTGILCYLGQQNGYISNPRTLNVQWHVGIRNKFEIIGLEVGITGDFDIWLTFEPTVDHPKQTVDEWDE